MLVFANGVLNQFVVENLKQKNLLEMKHKHKTAFMKTAFNFADCSSAKRLKVGAICVKDDRIISIGYNGTPSGWDNACEDNENRTKDIVIHAESNCISKLAKTAGGGDGSIMFVTHSPCLDCAKLIYQSGIKCVFYANEYRNTMGIEFLEEAGVEVQKLDL